MQLQRDDAVVDLAQGVQRTEIDEDWEEVPGTPSETEPQTPQPQTPQRFTNLKDKPHTPNTMP